MWMHPFLCLWRSMKIHPFFSKIYVLSYSLSCHCHLLLKCGFGNHLFFLSMTIVLLIFLQSMFKGHFFHYLFFLSMSIMSFISLQSMFEEHFFHYLLFLSMSVMEKCHWNPFLKVIFSITCSYIPCIYYHSFLSIAYLRTFFPLHEIQVQILERIFFSEAPKYFLFFTCFFWMTVNSFFIFFYRTGNYW